MGEPSGWPLAFSIDFQGFQGSILLKNQGFQG